jgi:hypothetical protein
LLDDDNFKVISLGGGIDEWNSIYNWNNNCKCNIRDFCIKRLKEGEI